MLRSSPIVPVFSSIQSENKIDYRSSKELINFYFDFESGKAPMLINKVLNDFDNYCLAVTALGNSISKLTFLTYTVEYLENLMIAYQTVPLFEFHEYSYELSSSS